MSLDSLQDLYIEHIQDLYSAEQQIIDALPKMIDKATNQELKDGFSEHLEQTREHARRLEAIGRVVPQGRRSVLDEEGTGDPRRREGRRPQGLRRGPRGVPEDPGGVRGRLSGPFGVESPREDSNLCARGRNPALFR